MKMERPEKNLTRVRHFRETDRGERARAREQSKHSKRHERLEGRRKKGGRGSGRGRGKDRDRQTTRKEEFVVIDAR